MNENVPSLTARIRQLEQVLSNTEATLADTQALVKVQAEELADLRQEREMTEAAKRDRG